MKLAALVSGGKDSIYALKKAMEGNEIVELISVESAEDSMFFHRQNLELVKLQSEALNIPLKYLKTEENKELQTLEESIGRLSNEVDGVVSGAIASEYQGDRIQVICDKFGLESITPLWHVDEEKFMEKIVAEGWDVMITKVAAQGLDKDWLGRKIDEESLQELKELKEKHGIHIAGEGGEYETLVLDCPIFHKKIRVTEIEKYWDDKHRSGRLKVTGELI